MKITDEMFAAIPQMVADGQTREQIALSYSVSVNTLQVMCSKRGISLRRVRRTRRTSWTGLKVPLDAAVLATLQVAAEEHHRRSVTSLVTELIEKIATDKLFVAVLDD